MVQSILTVEPRLPPPTHDINTAENTHALPSLPHSLTDSLTHTDWEWHVTVHSAVHL